MFKTGKSFILHITGIIFCMLFHYQTSSATTKISASHILKANTQPSQLILMSLGHVNMNLMKSGSVNF